ncbi:MAG: TonB-dependent receptor, partial [Chitinophagaceae bacterium]
LKATNWLTLTYRAALSMNELNVKGTSKGETPSLYAQTLRSFTVVPGFSNEQARRTSRLSSEFIANVQKTFNDFRLNVIAGQYFRHSDYSESRVGAGNLVVPEVFNVSNRTGELSGSNETRRSRLFGLYGTVGVSYKGWANVEFSGRNDWTSVLAKNNNSYFYPGVSGSLVLSDALTAVKNSSVVSYLKLRASWQKIGNTDLNPYSLDATYSQINGFPFGSIPGFSADDAAYDPNLKPEFTTSKEVGFEIGFLKNRLNFEVAFYQQDNTDQIIPILVSDATGYTSSNVNAASFTNRGIELDLKLTPLIKFRNGSIDIKANASYNTSEVNKIFDNLDRIRIASGFGNAANYAVIGQPAFVLLANDYARDELGRVIVDRASGLPTQDPNLKQFGRTLPLWIIGLNPSIEWKGIQLSAVAEYKGGHYAYNQIGSDMAWTGISKASAANHRERFVFPNSVYDDGTGKYVPNTDIAVSAVNTFYTGVYREATSNFITSAAAWRIREVALGYSIPKKLLGKQQLVKAVTVALNARNLALFLPSSNEYTDPDFNNTIGNSSGINTSKIQPPTRLYGANVTITF